MANFLGIDITDESVRVALLRTNYRSTSIVALEEQPLAGHPSIASAIHAVAAPLLARGDSVATCLPGDRLFVRTVNLPPTATRHLDQVLPFELEAELPFDLSEALYDSRVLPRASAKDPVSVLACVARTDQVQERIDTLKQALNVEPERVDTSAFSLANLVPLVPELGVAGPVGVLHLDARTSDLAVLRHGKVEFVRTVSGGSAGLPASAKPLARDLRQSLLAWRSQSGSVPEVVYLTGPGSVFSGAAVFLSSELGVSVTDLPALHTEPMALELQLKLPSFSRAVAVANGLGRAAGGANLRKGPLAFERGYTVLHDRIPLLLSLGVLIGLSFLFSAWMEYRSLTRQTDTLEEALAMVTKEVVGEEIRDPQMAEDAVSVKKAKVDDPMPQMDGFDVMVEISKAVPEEMTHDIEELDYQKSKVSLHGIVDSIPDAQQVATTLGAVRCFENVKIVRTNQVVNENRQKYLMEFEVKCPAEGTDKKAGTGDADSKEGDK